MIDFCYEMRPVRSFQSACFQEMFTHCHSFHACYSCEPSILFVTSVLRELQFVMSKVTQLLLLPKTLVKACNLREFALEQLYHVWFLHFPRFHLEIRIHVQYYTPNETGAISVCWVSGT